MEPFEKLLRNSEFSKSANFKKFSPNSKFRMKDMRIVQKIHNVNIDTFNSNGGPNPGCSVYNLFCILRAVTSKARHGLSLLIRKFSTLLTMLGLFQIISSAVLISILTSN